MKHLYALLLILFTCSCVSKNANDSTCRIVCVDNLYEQVLDEDINKIFANKQTIILSDSSKSYPVHIENIMCRNGRLYIQSRSLRMVYLLVYDLTGKFLFQVGEIGRARNEYLMITGFDVDNNGEIYINDILSNKILHFDAQGKYIRTLDAKYADTHSINKLDGSDEFLLCLSSWNANDPKIELIRYNFENNFDSVVTYYGKFIDDNYEVSAPNFTRTTTGVFFLNNLSDTVYKTNNRGEVVDKIYFDFADRNVPEKNKIDLEKKIEQEHLYDNYTTLAKFCCEDQKYIYGGLLDGNKYRYFIIDKSTKTIYKTKDDSFPAMGNVLGFDDKYLITKLDYASYKSNPNAFDEPLATALQSDKIAICLYSN